MSPIASYIEEKQQFGGPDPGPPKPGIMQVFYENGIPLMVDFLCPCGCGRTCPTHLITPGQKETDHHWSYKPGPTLSPSIRYLSGCKWHFNITDGKVIVHGDSGK